MDIVNVIIIVCIILLLMWAMYKRGKSDGLHKERMRMYDIIGKIPEGLEMDNLSVDEKFNVRVVIGYMLGKLHEG